MKIGAVLVKEGLITAHQLEEALKVQVIYGGRLGTNLVELGYIDLDTFSEALARHAGVPVATAEMFESADPAALRLLSREQVERLECFPLKVDGRKLLVALEDPHDIAKLDEIAFLTNLRVIAHLAPQMRLLYYLEKVYGLKRQLRYIRIAPELPPEPPAGAPAQQAQAAGPTAGAGESGPGLFVQPLAADPDGTFGLAAGPRLEDLPPAIVLPDDEPVVPIDSAFAAPPLAPVLPATPPAAVAPLPGPPPGWTGDAQTPARILPPRPAPPPDTSPLSQTEALAALAQAPHRDQIAEIVLRCTCRHFEQVILFVVRENNATGWRAMGPRSPQVAIESLVIPLDAPSIFETVARSRAPFFGLVPDQPLNRRFYQLLRSPRPRLTMVLPLLIREHLVNLLYADNGPRDVQPAALSEVTELLVHAAQAYERVILEAKMRMGL